MLLLSNNSIVQEWNCLYTQKENCHAAHAAVFCLCEMVSTNFKHINANIIIFILSGQTGFIRITSVLGVPVVSRCTLVKMKPAYMPSWKHDVFSRFILNFQFVVYHKHSDHSCLFWMADSSIGNLVDRWTTGFVIGAGSLHCPAPYLNLMQLLASYYWLA